MTGLTAFLVVVFSDVIYVTVLAKLGLVKIAGLMAIKTFCIQMKTHERKVSVFFSVFTGGLVPRFIGHVTLLTIAAKMFGRSVRRRLAEVTADGRMTIIASEWGLGIVSMTRVTGKILML
jgi:hypothetical protein